MKILDTPKDDTQTELRVNDRTRDDDQKALDNRMKALVERWTKGSKPKPANSPHDRITVMKDDVSELKAGIRRAANLHKVAVFFFKDRKDANGTVTVKYVPAEKPAKPAKDAQANGDQPSGDQPPQG